MNQSLARLIADYQDRVRLAVALMQASGIPLPATNIDWIGTAIAQRGELKGSVPYFKHGYGCAVQLRDGAIDFDFGAKGEIDGFTAGRLVHFAGARLPEYGIPDVPALHACFDAQVAAGALVYSGDILYYVAERS